MYIVTRILVTSSQYQVGSVLQLISIPVACLLLGILRHWLRSRGCQLHACPLLYQEESLSWHLP